MRPRAFWRRPSAADLDDEILGYVHDLARRYVDRGLAPDAAHRRALAEVGVEQVKAATRDV